MSEVPPVHEGEVLAGKFRVERVLGRGGMGVVVAATHLALGQKVALKFLVGAGKEHPEAIARFQREARASVRLKSEHVARVSDVGTLDDGNPYMVMEYLDGQDLDAVLHAEGPMAPDHAVDLLLQACDAVAEAHALGIVHRDLKPKNLFLTHRVSGAPLVKVLDFGISKLTGPGEDLSLTATAQVMGSPNYMSPEQLRASRDVDERADIWALGAILYELLVGAVPFRADTITHLVAIVVTEPPTPIERPLPEGLGDVIMRCLEKRREDRFASVAELAKALLPFASPETTLTVLPAVQAALGRGVPRPAPSSNPLVMGPASGVPADRPSFRVGHGATATAWGETQLDNSGASLAPLAPVPVAKTRALPLLGLAALLVAAGAGAFFAVRTTAVPPPPPVASSPPPPALEVPSVRVLPANTPLVSPTGGPDCPLPSTLATASTPPPRIPRVLHSASPAAPTPANSGADDLPSVRH